MPPAGLHSGSWLTFQLSGDSHMSDPTHGQTLMYQYKSAVFCDNAPLPRLKFIHQACGS